MIVTLFALWLVAILAEKLQQHQEQVDEVEIEPQGAHDGLLTGDRAVILNVVHLLDLLRVVCRQASEDEHADHRNGKLECR